MVPDALVRLDALPLTINGKLDRGALPDPAVIRARVHAPPRSALDATVCRVIARLLDRQESDVGIDDDFFMLGGNSIMSVKLVAALAREAGIATSVGHLLANRSVRAFVDNLTGGAGPDQPIARTATPDAEGSVLSFAQERLWFIEKFEDGTTAYSLPLVLDVDDSVDERVLASSVADLIDRHEVLRTLIKEGPAGPATRSSSHWNGTPGGSRRTKCATRRQCTPTSGRSWTVRSTWQRSVRYGYGCTASAPPAGVSSPS